MNIVNLCILLTSKTLTKHCTYFSRKPKDLPTLADKTIVAKIRKKGGNTITDIIVNTASNKAIILQFRR